MASVRLARQLLFAGRRDVAQRLYERIARAPATLLERDAIASARVQYARAMLALFAGDSGAYLERCEAALAAFERAGDRRNGCMQRSICGYANLEIGDSKRAVEMLRAALAEAESIGLGNVVGHARHNLGLALARLGRIEEARAEEERAIVELSSQGDRRLEAGARIYLAKILLASADPGGAAEQARTAVDRLAAVPSMRPYAIATLAQTQLVQGQTADALVSARSAMALAESVGLEEGEAAVRLTLAEALWAAGRRDEARTALSTARDRLTARAALIANERARASFLAGVPDHARTFGLAAEWLL